VTAPDLRHDLHIEIQFDGVNWVDVTPDLLRQEVNITYGRQDEMSAVQPTEVNFALDNASGAYTPDLPTSPYYPNVDLGIAARVRVGADIRVVGEVTSWALSWPHGDLSGDDLDEAPGDARVDVTVSGILRRIGIVGKRALSAPRRYIPTTTPAAYWPLEDGQDAAVGKSAIGGEPLTPAGTHVKWEGVPGDPVLPRALPRWGAGELAPHLLPVVELPALSEAEVGQQLRAALPELGSWVVDFAYRKSSGEIITSVQVSSGGLDESASAPPFVLLTLTSQRSFPEQNNVDVFWGDAFFGIQTQTPFNGALHHFRLTATQDGADTELAVFIDGVLAASGTASNLVVRGRAFALGWRMFFLDTQGRPGAADVGHVAVWDAANAPPLADAVAAMLGYAGEPAGRRIERLCGQEGIPFAAVGDLDDTELMAAQRPVVFHDLVVDAAVADAGILHEQQAAVPGLAYRTRRSLYNQAPAVILDASTGPGEITHPFAPILDDQGAVNDITVERQDGASVRRVDEADAQRRGRYQAQVMLDVASDLQLPDQAGWRLHLGTWAAMRYPAVSPALNAVPGLIPAWQALRLGDRLQVVGLPPQHPAGTVDLIVQGWTETIRPWRWDAEITCRPAGPYTVGTYVEAGVTAAPDAAQRYSPQGCAVLVEFHSGVDTTLTVHDDPGESSPWTTDPAAFPFDIVLDGVRLRVVSADAPFGTGAQTLHVQQQPINGVIRTIPVGTPVKLWAPARYAL
jgi:hypothetical protein